MIKIFGIIIISLLLTRLLKDFSSPLSVFIPICCFIIISIMISDELAEIIGRINEYTDTLGIIKPYFKIITKVVIITLLSQFIISICRDNGEGALALQADVGFRIIIIITAMPLMNIFLSMINGMLK